MTTITTERASIEETQRLNRRFLELITYFDGWLLEDVARICAMAAVRACYDGCGDDDDQSKRRAAFEVMIDWMRTTFEQNLEREKHGDHGRA